MFDSVIIGAGFAGCVIAQKLASDGKRVLIIEKRNHIGGNCYDYYDQNGVLVHKYGPHLFHTDNTRVFNYLSQFTDWHIYQHRVLGHIDGQKVPLPFNLDSLHSLFPKTQALRLEQLLISHYGTNKKVPILELRQTGEPELIELADFIYDKVFLNYTLKQWGCTPEEISPEVTNRVPINISKDDRYFQDKYQAIPKNGYTKLFDNMLNHPNIVTMTGCEYQRILDIDIDKQCASLFGTKFEGEIVYTGPIDEICQFRFGDLPYRSLQFHFEYHQEDNYQSVTTENYPNNFDFTRITEFKHLTKQKCSGTTIIKEYPQDFDRHDPNKNIPYYPKFDDASRKAYEKYVTLVGDYKQLTVVGRLAEYRYYDMDDVVERALCVYEERLAK